MTVKLESGELEEHYGRNVDRAPALLARWQKGEGYIPSEADIRLLGVKNFSNAPQIARNYWDSSTLSPTKGETVKVILPYDNSENHQLTEAARFGLSLINPNETLVNYGVNLDIDGRWEKLDGSGVYVMEREGLVLNQDLTEKQAMKHKLLLTKLGHPDYVDNKFARSKDEVAEIIGKTFELGKKEYSYGDMLKQSLPAISEKGVLRVWLVNGLGGWSRSVARSVIDDDVGRFAFYSAGGAKKNAEGVGEARIQLQTLERMLKPEYFNQIELLKIKEID